MPISPNQRLAALLRGERRVGRKPEAKHLAKFKDRLLECPRSARFSPKLPKTPVQKCLDLKQKFENRLLGPTNNPIYFSYSE